MPVTDSICNSTLHVTFSQLPSLFNPIHVPRSLIVLSRDPSSPHYPHPVLIILYRHACSHTFSPIRDHARPRSFSVPYIPPELAPVDSAATLVNSSSLDAAHHFAFSLKSLLVISLLASCSNHCPHFTYLPHCYHSITKPRHI